MRDQWQAMTNDMLRTYAPQTKPIDGRSYEERQHAGEMPTGLIPGRHLGPAVTNMTRKAIRIGTKVPCLYEREVERKAANQNEWNKWYDLTRSARNIERSVGDITKTAMDLTKDEAAEDVVYEFSKEIINMLSHNPIKSLFTNFKKRTKQDRDPKERDEVILPAVVNAPPEYKSLTELHLKKVRKEEKKRLKKETIWQNEVIIPALRYYVEMLETKDNQNQAHKALKQLVEKIKAEDKIDTINRGKFDPCPAMLLISDKLTTDYPHLHQRHIDACYPPERNSTYERHVAAAKKRKAENQLKPRQRRRRNRGLEIGD